jgi:hypothetical protein
LPIKNIRDITTQHHVLLIDSLPSYIATTFFSTIVDNQIKWNQSYNDFHGGGFAQPKLYAAFSKDLTTLPHYIPHSKDGKPLLVYEAQPYHSFPSLMVFERILSTMGYTNFNFVTVLMYAGEGSHISAHRDREQIYGYTTAQDVIATFVFGASRSLKIIHDAGSYKKSVLLPNTSNSLYIMQGIQRFTKHEKCAGDGLSYSVIFRQLVPYTGHSPSNVLFNEEVKIDWSHAIIPRAWRVNPDVANLPIGTTFELREFNRRRLHPVQMCSVSSQGGFATSIVLYSDMNVVSPCGTKVWFTGYRTNDKTMALNNTLLATHNVSLIAIYKKLEDSCRKFLGNFFVDKVITLQQRMYFTFIRYE